MAEVKVVAVAVAVAEVAVVAMIVLLAVAVAVAVAEELFLRRVREVLLLQLLQLLPKHVRIQRTV